MKLKGKIIIGAMVLAAISGMQSMAAEKEVYQLGEVLVTANKYSVPDLEIPAATEVISGQQIENMGAKSVMEVMKNILALLFQSLRLVMVIRGFAGFLVI